MEYGFIQNFLDALTSADRKPENTISFESVGRNAMEASEEKLDFIQRISSYKPRLGLSRQKVEYDNPIRSHKPRQQAKIPIQIEDLNNNLVDLSKAIAIGIDSMNYDLTESLDNVESELFKLRSDVVKGSKKITHAINSLGDRIEDALEFHFNELVDTIIETNTGFISVALDKLSLGNRLNGTEATLINSLLSKAGNDMLNNSGRIEDHFAVLRMKSGASKSNINKLQKTAVSRIIALGYPVHLLSLVYQLEDKSRHDEVTARLLGLLENSNHNSIEFESMFILNLLNRLPKQYKSDFNKELTIRVSYKLLLNQFHASTTELERKTNNLLEDLQRIDWQPLTDSKYAMWETNLSVLERAIFKSGFKKEWTYDTLRKIYPMAEEVRSELENENLRISEFQKVAMQIHEAIEVLKAETRKAIDKLKDNEAFQIIIKSPIHDIEKTVQTQVEAFYHRHNELLSRQNELAERIDSSLQRANAYKLILSAQDDTLSTYFKRGLRLVREPYLFYVDALYYLEKRGSPKLLVDGISIDDLESKMSLQQLPQNHSTKSKFKRLLRYHDTYFLEENRILQHHSQDLQIKLYGFAGHDWIAFNADFFIVNGIDLSTTFSFEDVDISSALYLTIKSKTHVAVFYGSEGNYILENISETDTVMVERCFITVGTTSFLIGLNQEAKQVPMIANSEDFLFVCGVQKEHRPYLNVKLNEHSSVELENFKKAIRVFADLPVTALLFTAKPKAKESLENTRDRFVKLLSGCVKPTDQVLMIYFAGASLYANTTRIGLRASLSLFRRN